MRSLAQTWRRLYTAHLAGLSLGRFLARIASLRFTQGIQDTTNWRSAQAPLSHRWADFVALCEEMGIVVE